MQRSLVLSAILLSLAPLASAADCPDVSVSAPAYVSSGESITMTVSLSGGDANVTPTYNWTISNGVIEEGQGTSTIKVDTTDFEQGYVTATVDIGGYDPECPTSYSASTEVGEKASDEEEAEEPAEEQPTPPPSGCG